MFMRPFRTAFVGTVISSCITSLGATAQADTQVTTYVVKVQEEREQTRWTLTEWLKIKERMKMMDVWLAMFSDPQKEKFQPELMLSYDLTRSHYLYTGGASGSQSSSLSGSEGRAQLWLTNLIASTVGIRTLNIDFGAEGYRRQTGDSAPSAAATGAVANAAPSSLAATRRLDTEYYAADLRLFGKNIQDSSLVVKYGAYANRNGLIDSTYGTSDNSSRGLMAGADLQLYVLRALGIDGNYIHFGDTNGINGSTEQSGSYLEYTGFVEISLLRLSAGLYQEQWQVTRQGQTLQSTEKGSVAGMKLQF